MNEPRTYKPGPRYWLGRLWVNVQYMVETIIVAFLLAAIQLAMAYLGWRVTMNPPQGDSEKAKYEGGFWIIGVAGIALIIFSTYRSGDVHKEIAVLNDQVAALRHTRIGFTIRGLAVEDATQADRDLAKRPFREGRKGQFNVLYRNVGSAPATNVRILGKAMLAWEKPDLDAIFIEITRQYDRKWKGDELVPQQGMYFTAGTEPLTKTQVANIYDGTTLIFILGTVRFTDATGNYQQEFCSYLQPPGTSPVWHPCSTHNRELKIGDIASVRD